MVQFLSDDKMMTDKTLIFWSATGQARGTVIDPIAKLLFILDMTLLSFCQYMNLLLQAGLILVATRYCYFKLSSTTFKALIQPVS